jgi:hypothetical protein
VTELNRQQRDQPDRRAPVPYASSGHPSFEQLMAEHGTGPIIDVSALPWGLVILRPQLQ